MSSSVTNDLAPVLMESRDHGYLFDVIDALRSQGVSRYIPLPQLIVCGDQSSGKSSVLEAVSGIRFPTKDSLCTRFATEVIMRRASDVKISVSISPGANRSYEEKVHLSRFEYADATIHKLPDVIEKAKAIMGVGADAKAFTEDVLRVELFGPNQAQLTLVDLPGLIQSENKQQSTADVHLVTNLVKSYMLSSRSVILAVVSAKNDYANQSVTRLAHESDPKGQRTLGIVTKPDTLHVGSDSEKAFVDLVKNEAVSFRLGWHVLKNRDWPDRECTVEERDAAEKQFFSQGVWSLLNPSWLGVNSLKPRLSSVLRDQIISELPSLMWDVKVGIEESRSRLSKLGDARQTMHEQRIFLVKISQSFSRLVKAAVDGVYIDDFFGDAKTERGYSKRLRAVVQNQLQQFSKDMLHQGHRREIVDDDKFDEYETGPRRTKRSTYLSEVQYLMKRSRGRELPGLFNPLVIGDLFYEQSEPWKGLVDICTARLQDAAKTCLDFILKHVADENTCDGLDREVLTSAMEEYVKKLGSKIDEIMEPHQRGHPITYNHYFTETIQEARRDHNEKKIAGTLKRYFGLNLNTPLGPISNQQSIDLQRLTKKLSRTTEPDMEVFSSSEATDCMQAYYKVRGLG